MEELGGWGGNEGVVSDMYIFYEMPRQYIVTWEHKPHRSGLALIESRVLYIGGNVR